MLSKLVEDNYKDILLAATRITRRTNVKQNKALINETYLALHGKKIPTDNIGFLMYFNRTMKIIHIDQRSTYNKHEKVNSVEHIYEQINEEWKEIEIQTEQTNESTKELIKELSYLSEEKAVQYLEVMDFKKGLPPNEREIFDLHYEKGLSSREIAKLMEEETGWKMSYVRYNEMINKVKKKLHG